MTFKEAKAEAITNAQTSGEEWILVIDNKDEFRILPRRLYVPRSYGILFSTEGARR